MKNFTARMSSADTPFLPEQSITHEGLFAEYFFDTGSEKEKLFSCNWNYALSADPLSSSPQFFLCCGMNSNLDGDGLRRFGRPPLNLIVVLDISGSMRRLFGSEQRTLLDVAKDCIYSLLQHLDESDAFGFVIFDSEAKVVQELSPWRSIDLKELKESIAALEPQGGTDMGKGLRCATAAFQRFLEAQRKEAQPKKTSDKKTQNRIIFLTDAKPDDGENAKEGLFGISQKNASEKIYTTFFGLGIDFGIELVHAITQIPACNYYAVKSAAQFRKLLDSDFDYLVTPCCFNVQVKMKMEDKSAEELVARVYGSAGNELSPHGVLVKIDSLFPSAKDTEEGTKGGVVLIHLEKFHEKIQRLRSSGGGDAEIPIVLEYDDAFDEKHVKEEHIVKICVPAKEGDFYSNSAVRKAVALTRFVNLMRWFIRDTLQESPAHATEKNGIPPAEVSFLSNPKRRKMELSPEYKIAFTRFAKWFGKEAEEIGDKKMEKQLKQLEDLLAGTAM